MLKLICFTHSHICKVCSEARSQDTTAQLSARISSWLRITELFPNLQSVCGDPEFAVPSSKALPESRQTLTRPYSSSVSQQRGDTSGARTGARGQRQTPGGTHDPSSRPSGSLWAAACPSVSPEPRRSAQPVIPIQGQPPLPHSARRPDDSAKRPLGPVSPPPAGRPAQAARRSPACPTARTPLSPSAQPPPPRHLKVVREKL